MKVPSRKGRSEFGKGENSVPIVKFTQPAEFDLQFIEYYISYELQNLQAADDTIDGIINKR